MMYQQEPDYEQELAQVSQQDLQRELKELQQMENSPGKLEQVLQQCQAQLQYPKKKILKEEQYDERRDQRRQIQKLLDRHIIQQYQELGGFCKQIAQRIRQKVQIPIKSNQVHRRLGVILMRCCRSIEKYVKRHDLVPVCQQSSWDNLRLHKHQNTLLNLNKLLIHTHELDDYARDISIDKKQQMLELMNTLLVNQIPDQEDNKKKQTLDSMQVQQIIRLYKFLNLVLRGQSAPSTIAWHDHSSSQHQSDSEVCSTKIVKQQQQSQQQQNNEEWTEQEEISLCDYTNQSRTTSESQKQMQTKYGPSTKWNSIERINAKVQSMQLNILTMLKKQAGQIYKYVNISTPQARKTLTYPTVAKMTQTIIYDLMDRMTLSFSQQLLKYHQCSLLKQVTEFHCNQMLKRVTELIYQKEHSSRKYKAHYKKQESNEHEMIFLQLMEQEVRLRQNHK